MTNYILQYYNGIKKNKIVVGQWIRLLYEYIVAAIKDIGTMLIKLMPLLIGSRITVITRKARLRQTR